MFCVYVLLLNVTIDEIVGEVASILELRWKWKGKTEIRDYR